MPRGAEAAISALRAKPDSKSDAPIYRDPLIYDGNLAQNKEMKALLIQDGSL